MSEELNLAAYADMLALSTQLTHPDPRLREASPLALFSGPTRVFPAHEGSNEL